MYSHEKLTATTLVIEEGIASAIGSAAIGADMEAAQGAPAELDAYEDNVAYMEDYRVKESLATHTLHGGVDHSETDNSIVYEATERSYLSKMAKHPLLTPSEEVKLAKNIEKGDLAAKDKLVRSNIRLVMDVAKKYPADTSLTYSDMINQGVIGLIRAAEKYDYRTGNRFSTYATIWIRQSIQRGMQNTEEMIRSPVHIHQKLNALRRAEKEYLAVNNGQEPSLLQLSEATGIPTDDITELQRLATKPVSLNSPVGDGGDSEELGYYLPSGQPDVPDLIIKNEEASRVITALETLPRLEANIVTDFYGIGNQAPIPAASLAEHYGISTAAIYKIVKSAQKQLKSALSNQQGSNKKRSETMDGGSPSTPEVVTNDKQNSAQISAHEVKDIVGKEPLSSLTRMYMKEMYLTSNEIAEKYEVTASTINTTFHLASKKLGVKGTGSLLIYGVKHGIIDLDEVPAERTAELTSQEEKILKYGHSRTYAELAEMMGIETTTIRTHWHSIFQKTGAEHKRQIILMAIKDKLIKLD